MDVSQLRAAYNSDILHEEELASDPFTQFDIWFKDALKSSYITEPNAMCLSTCTTEGKPSSRYVLMKSFSKSGFVFFSNYESRKGKELDINPHSCILFYWSALHRQVRIEGQISRISDEKSKDYFKARPKISQASASISKQSQVISSRLELESKFKKCLDQYAASEIPKPDNWGGYLLQPSYFEFWQGHSSRLHDRIVFKLINDTWNIVRLNP